jgi:hypothetical protein
MVFVIFYYQNNFKQNSCLVHLCYLVATSTGCKLQLFQRWREWEYAGKANQHSDVKHLKHALRNGTLQTAKVQRQNHINGIRKRRCEMTEERKEPAADDFPVCLLLINHNQSCLLLLT